VVDAPLALAFTAGMVATVNPCGFAMLPAYLSFFIGSEGDEPSPAAAVARGLAVGAVVSLGLDLYGPLKPGSAWHIEAHQFRIEARADAAGLPTPEGVHRDGVDYVIVMLVDRVNIESGTTTVHALDGRELGSFTLARAFDAALVDDSRVMHGVTPVRPMDAARAAWRDVLVVTYRSQVPGARRQEPGARHQENSTP